MRSSEAGAYGSSRAVVDLLRRASIDSVTLPSGVTYIILTAPMKSSFLVCLFAFALSVSALPGAGGISSADASSLAGTLRIKTPPDTPATSAVVYAEPLGAETPRRPGKFTLVQKNKTFVPRLIVVPVGSTITFPNQDPIFHNVFSLTQPGPFDLGLYRAGASKDRVFTAPATYRVFCNIHPQMTALIVVAPTPYTTRANEVGAYTLELPPGRYRLTAVSERSAPVSKEVTVGAGATTAPEMALDESTFVQVPHKNKFGQEYKPPPTGS